MSEYFEMVIFTAGIQSYADWVLDKIGANKYINHKLYRQHVTINGRYYVKDLSKLGRDLRRTIIVDNIENNFQLQPHNGIVIKSWTGEENDTALLQLAPILKEIVLKKVEDAREALSKFSNQIRIQSKLPRNHYQLVIDM